jgi:predicted PurR-regulated permease PerM
VSGEAASPPPPGAGLLLERALLLFLFAVLLLGVLLVLRPFATAILFGSILAIALWPLRDGLVGRGVKPSVAASLLLLLLLLIAVAPVLAVAPSLVATAEIGFRVGREAIENAPDVAPAWLTGLPFIGAQVAAGWERVMASETDIAALLAPYGAQIRGFVLSLGSAIVDSALQLVLSLAAAALLWTTGEAIGEALAHAARRLGGETALRSLRAAEGAVRSVAYGVVGTSILQGVLQGIGLAIAGVPGAALLGFLTLLFSISQVLGPLVIVTWAGAAWWLFQQGSTAWAIFMLAWGLLLVSSSDNVLRPLLIKRGVQMPLSLIILGVFGGFVAFGFLGLFIGPTLLAVAYVLLSAWRATPGLNPSGIGQWADGVKQPPDQR